ncbi:MAG: response regulator [bacterium]
MKQILIVDDERIVLEVLEKMVSYLGYHTTVSETGMDALQKFKRKTFDLVMVDLLLPGLSGWELIQKLHRNGK